MTSVLVVDDEKNMLMSLKAILQDEGYRVGTSPSGEDGLVAMEAEPFEIVITDLKMSGMTGVDLLERIRHTHPHIPVILMTAYATPKSAVEAIKAGAFDYIPKPFDPEEIIFALRKAVEFISIQKENVRLRESLHAQNTIDEIVGDDPAVMEIRNLIRSVASTKATILIQGESGTGKELVAKAIHELSDRRSHNFVPVNCAAIPETLLESELFGHEKGAFTGALYTKKGKFELADGGTIYLDEVGDMSLALQAKILRVLEDGQFERIGSTNRMHSSARVLAATNKDLRKAIGEGQFREDLYFRLKVITVDLPPLRERVGDLSKLVSHFIRKFNAVYDRNIHGIHGDALKLMSLYPWPGNIRELRNVIERGVLLEKSTLLSREALPDEIRVSTPEPHDHFELAGNVDFKEAVQKFEKQLLQWALEKNRYRMSASAKTLGLTRHSLRHYLLKYFPEMRKFDAD